MAAADAIAEKGLPVDEQYQPPVKTHKWHVDNMEEYRELYQRSIGPDREQFWREQAEFLRWKRPFDQVVYEDLENGDVRWFTGGKMNVCDNCVDRWAEKKPDKTAIIYEGDEPTDVRYVTWKELQQQTCKWANMYKHFGARKGDRITIYLPMIPEAAFAMLAATRIGLVHSVVFAGFSADALRDRIVDALSPWVVTADEGLRGSKVIGLKNIADEAMKGCESIVRTCFVWRRTGGQVNMQDGRDVLADEIVCNMRPFCMQEEMDAEDPLFMLYTSGSTGTPKGVVHCTAGYLLWTSLTVRTVFDLQEDDVYASVADIGWITGHSYIIYGPLANGNSTFMFESVPTYPNCGRYWDMVQRHKITQFYTAPTAIRTLMRFGEKSVKQYDRSSLKVLGSVGEPINPEAWRWYYEVVGVWA